MIKLRTESVKHARGRLRKALQPLDPDRAFADTDHTFRFANGLVLSVSRERLVGRNYVVVTAVMWSDSHLRHLVAGSRLSEG